MNIVMESGDPYKGVLEQFFVNMFPGANKGNGCQIFEAVSTEIFGTAKSRYGPMPNAESQVVIRDVIRKSIKQGVPINVLSPWGSTKPDMAGEIDLAEVGALKTFSELNARVKQFYAPGLNLNIRIEDTTGFHMFRRFPGFREQSMSYCDRFVKLIKIMGCDFINPILESTILNEDEMNSFVEDNRGLFLSYLKDTEGNVPDEPSKALRDLGWNGNIPMEQRDFYRESYRRHYPGITSEDENMMLAEYLTQAVARYRFKATGSHGWDNFIQISFAPPVPGAPQNLVGRQIHYRTFPCHITRNHMPPWRGKGFLRVNGEVNLSLVSWGDKREYNPMTAMFSNGQDSVIVRTDYSID